MRVARAGCWALYNLAFLETNHARLLQGVPLAAEAMTRYPNDFAVQFACCQFCGNLGTGNASGQEAIAEAGMLESTITAMDNAQFSGDGRMQRAGCRALWGIVVNHAANQVKKS